VGVFAATIIVIACFWSLLPERYAINESSDYRMIYEPIARNIAQGKGYAHPTDSAMAYAPGLPMILAGVFKLASATNISESAILNSLILICMGFTSVFISIVARTLWGVGGIA
jgi:hypothetical protein